MEKLQIEYIPLAEIIPYSKNPRKNDKAVDIVVKSIKEFGFKNPIILDKNNEIVAGHTRLKAAMQLNMQEVPIIWADDLNEEQVKAFRIMDNRSTEFSEWDEELLKGELEWLEDKGFNLSLTGFGDGEEEEDEFDTDDALKNPKYKIETGELRQLGDHFLLCGDSTDQEAVKQLYNEDINLVFTSPPYNMQAKLYENYKDNLESEEYIRLNTTALKLIKDKIKGFIFWNLSYNRKTRWEFMEIFNRIRRDVGLRFLELIVWNKKHALPITSKRMLTRQYEDIGLFGSEDQVTEQLELYWVGDTGNKTYFNKKTGKGISNYWEINVNNTQLNNLKACFPVKLAGKGIKLMTNEGEVVADPFGGSGTTLIACEQLGRKCYTMELDPAYCSVIIERWEKLTGKKAVKI